MPTATATFRWLEAEAVLARLCASQGDAIETASRWWADAVRRVDGLDTPVGPATTTAAVAIVNFLNVRVAELLSERDAIPPVISRASVVGAERSRTQFDAAYREHARRIARAIIREDGG